jgi:hypothetical protein
MVQTLTRILRAMAFVLVALISLGMALIFTITTLIAVVILFVAMRLRGQTFSVQEYWTTRQSKRKPIFGKGVGDNQQVSDIEARDVR